MDLRFIRNFRVAGLRLQGMVDAYNIFNNTAVLAENTRYGSSLAAADVGARRAAPEVRRANELLARRQER